jgi:hypothetical protein
MSDLILPSYLGQLGCEPGRDREPMVIVDRQDQDDGLAQAPGVQHTAAKTTATKWASRRDVKQDRPVGGTGSTEIKWSVP